jgi:superkiller protein 3
MKRLSQCLVASLVLLLSFAPQRLTAQPPTSAADPLVTQGEAAQSAGRFAQAEAIWRQVIQQTPKSPDAHANLGFALRRQNKLTEAIAAFRQALKLDPKHAYAQHSLAYVLSEQGKLAEALAAYRQALQLDPTHALVHYGIGNVLYRQGKLDEAIAAYRLAVQVPDRTSDSLNAHPLAYFKLGYALQDQGKLEEATAAYRRAVALAPTYALAHHNLAYALAQQGKLEEAIAAYRLTISLEPTNGLVYTNLGYALEQQGQLEAAIAAYQQALKLNPKDITALNNLGLAFSRQGKLEEAIAIYRRVIDLQPKDSLAHNNLGFVFYKQGKLEEAITYYRLAIAMPNTPTERSTAHALAHRNLGYAFEDQGKLEAAIESYRQAARLNPKDGLTLVNLGYVLSQRGQAAAAMQAYRQALQLPNAPANRTSVHVLAHTYLGEALQRDGQTEAALAQYQQALRLDRDYVPAQRNLQNAQRRITSSLPTAPAIERIPSGDPLTTTKRSVVRVVAQFANTAEQRGTGWVFKRQGDRALIVTNRHVVIDQKGDQVPAKSITIELFSQPQADQGYRRLTAQLVRHTPLQSDLDLAVLEVTGLPNDIAPLPLSETVSFPPASVTIIGHPTIGLPWSVEEGRVSNVNRLELQISGATLASGNSGSPVLDERKRVVGVVVAVQDLARRVDRPQLSTTGGFGYALRIDQVSEQLRQWGVAP